MSQVDQYEVDPMFGGAHVSVRFGDDRLPERFWEKVAINDQTGCWGWTASKAAGYGRFYVGRLGRLLAQAHRYAFEMLVGIEDESLDADHLCRNRACVNPAHIEMVSRRDNTIRGEGPAAINYAKRHCHKGHELVGLNLRIAWRNGNERRWCRTCLRESYRKADVKRGRRAA